VVLRVTRKLQHVNSDHDKIFGSIPNVGRFLLTQIMILK
jgi:hypothetical protein